MELPPLAAAGMSIGPQVVQPQPTAIVTIEMRTKVPGGIDSTGAAMGERHGIGPWRRNWSIFRGLLFTQGTVGCVRQTRERFGLTGAFALRLDGLGGYLVSDTGWTWPEVWQHETQPE